MSEDVYVENLMEYINIVINFENGLSSSNDNIAVYRGQKRACFACVPSIARIDKFTPDAIYKGQKIKPAEYRFFIRFRDMTLPLLHSWIHATTREEQEWRQLVLAQHFSLPTRLLDWTTKPLVALFFAVEEETTDKEDAGIFRTVVDRKRMFSVTALAKNNSDVPMYDFKTEEVGFFIPPDIDHRVTVQGSVFAIRHDPCEPVEYKPFIKIKYNFREHIMLELRHLGITRASLFPDLEGISKSLKDESKDWGLGSGVIP